MKAECHYGYPVYQLEEELGERFNDLANWMRGQTMMLCNAEPQREWQGRYLVVIGPPLCDKPHGPVVYTWDYERWGDGRPVID